MEDIELICGSEIVTKKVFCYVYGKTQEDFNNIIVENNDKGFFVQNDLEFIIRHKYINNDTGHREIIPYVWDGETLRKNVHIDELSKELNLAAKTIFLKYANEPVVIKHLYLSPINNISNFRSYVSFYATHDDGSIIIGTVKTLSERMGYLKKPIQVFTYLSKQNFFRFNDWELRRGAHLIGVKS